MPATKLGLSKTIGPSTNENAPRVQPWIPPGWLIVAHLSHGASWILLLLFTWTTFSLSSWPELAWIHLVALGWLTLTALAVLLFVLPQFTDAQWRGERAARFGIALFAIGAFGLVSGFLLRRPSLLAQSAGVTLSGLAFYIVPAMATLRIAMRLGGAQAAIARAFTGVLAFLALAAALGFAMAVAFNRTPAYAPLVHAGAPAHAHLAAVGWLTMLVMGVSARTIRVIAGSRSPKRWAHVASNGAVLIGVVILALSFWFASVWLRWLGALLVGAGVTVYFVDMANVLLHARVRHRPPQAFMMAALFWLLAAGALGARSISDDQVALAYAFVGLAGWIGQMVVAHLHHIGIRLIATLRFGDDDETQPSELLTPALSWATFVLFQGAVAAGAVGLVDQRALALRFAGLLGIAGWAAMSANVLLCRFRERPNSLPNN